MKKVLRVLSTIAAVILVISSSLSIISTRQAFSQNDNKESFSTELAKQMAEIYQQKQSLTPVQRKISSNILKVVREVEKRISGLSKGDMPKFRDFSTSLLKMDDTGSIEVKLAVKNTTQEHIKQLIGLGMQINLILPEYGIIEGILKYNRVEAVAALDFITNMAAPGYPLAHTGSVTTQGDAVLKAADTRAAFSVNGTGVKVGVISDGVNHLSNSVGTGDLPSSPAVNVLKAGDGDEGTAMLEIIHDLAPGAPLAFYAPSTSSDMVAGIRALKNAGCRIVVDDIGFADEPKFEDGPIATEARTFYTGGGLYVTAAGNDAQSHYSHNYVRTTGPGGSYPFQHDYGSGDIGNTLTIPNSKGITAILQWNNRWGQSGDDFDLYLVRSSDGTVISWSDNVQDGNDNPIEAFSWTNNTGSSVTAFIAVPEYRLTSPPNSLVLDYSVWNASGLQYVMPENSVIGHAAVEEVLSVAAANYASPGTVENFSSRGPGKIYFPSLQDRKVPNITAVDGVQTKTGQLGYFSNPFYGTSAAAPHVAAIAALLWQFKPSLSSNQIRDAILSKAIDLGSPGWDVASGFGRIDAYNSASALDTTPPTVTLTTPPNNATNVMVSTNIDITFSEAMKQAQTQAAFSINPSVAGAFSWAGNVMTFNPTADLAYSTAYNISIGTGAQDMVGNPIAAAYNFSFTTSAPPDSTPPTVILTAPANGATNIPIGTNIDITFSEAMKQAQTQAAFSINPSVAGAFSWAGNVMTFNPTADLAYSTAYNISIGTGAQDMAGNPMTAAYTFSFTTLTTPPAVTTGAASNITVNSARFNGNLTALGSASSVNVSFLWGTTSGNLTNETSPAEAKTGIGAFSFDLTGLNPAVTYYYKAKAVGHGTSYGEEKSFTTLTTPPSVTTSDASNITINSAKLNGNLTALGSASSINVSFLWGTTSGNLTNETSPAEAKTAIGTFFFNLTGLNPGRTYYYKAKAAGDGTSYGEEKSFTTLTTPPSVTTSDASNITINSAKLNGNLTALGSASSINVSFLWSTTSGNLTNETSPAESKTGSGTFSFDLTGLISGTTYYYKAKAVGHGTTIAAEEKSFTTLSPPAVTTSAATGVTFTSATLNGNLTSLGTASTVNVSFEYGTTTSYGNTTTTQPMYAPGTFSFNVTGLLPGMTYHYRAKADGGAYGAATGSDTSFSTPFAAIRNIPSYTGKGQTFDVTITFVAPADNFNAIGFSDTAPGGWNVQVNTTWCSPVAMEALATNNRAQYIWAGPYNQGQVFTVLYKVSVPADAAPGLHSFTNGKLEYFVGGGALQTENITGKSQIEAIEGARIQGETWEVKGAILGDVTLTLDGTTLVVSSAQGVYQLNVTAIGQHIIVASKTGFRSYTRTITVDTPGNAYTLLGTFEK